MKNAFEYEEDLAILREKLTRCTETLERWHDLNLQREDRLFYSEQKVSELSKLLREAFDAGDNYVFGTDLYERMNNALNNNDKQFGEVRSVSITKLDGKQEGRWVKNSPWGWVFKTIDDINIDESGI